MPRFRRYHPPVPVGSIVVRVVEQDGEPYGFIREVTGEDEEVHPTEQKPLDQVWRLIASRTQANPNVEVFVETDANFEWRPEWGTLEPR